MKTINLDYSKYLFQLEQLEDKIRYILGFGTFDSVIALQPGGIHMGLHLSYRFSIPLTIINTSISFRAWPLITPLSRCLVVDSKISSGKTMTGIVDELSRRSIKVTTAVLYTNPKSKFKPNCYVKSTSNQVIMPWEIVGGEI